MIELYENNNLIDYINAYAENKEFDVCPFCFPPNNKLRAEKINDGFQIKCLNCDWQIYIHDIITDEKIKDAIRKQPYIPCTNTPEDFLPAEGKYRVIGVDTFANERFIIGDFDSLLIAQGVARLECGTMLKTHVYDDGGRHVYEDGSF